MKSTNSVYFVAVAAILLAALAYLMAWVNFDHFKNLQKGNEEKANLDFVAYSAPFDEIQESAEMADPAVLRLEVSTGVLNEVSLTQAMTQEEVSATVSAVEFLHQQKLDAMPLWQKNSSHVVLDPHKKHIAIVIDDVGVVEDRSMRSVEELPKEVTLSFLPYGESTQTLALQAREKGHEIMVHLPMQPKAREDGYIINPGNDALLTSLSLEEIQPLVYKNLSFLGALSVGVNNHMGSAFTEWNDGLVEVFKVLEKQKLMFLDSITTPHSAAPKAIQNFNIPFLKRDVFLDHVIEEDKILDALHKAERIAQRQGYAIAIGHPHEMTTNVIIKWAKELEKRNIQLVPISALIVNKG